MAKVINMISQGGMVFIFLEADSQLTDVTVTNKKGNHMGNRGRCGSTTITTELMIQNNCFMVIFSVIFFVSFMIFFILPVVPQKEPALLNIVNSAEMNDHNQNQNEAALSKSPAVFGEQFVPMPLIWIIWIRYLTN